MRLRHVPAYRTLVDEASVRCLALMTAPRSAPDLSKKRRGRVTDPEALLPHLPDIRDLRPFPDTVSVVYRGHGGGARVNAISCDPRGQWLASGASDGSLRFWEVDTGRCVASLMLGAAVRAASWCPIPGRRSLAVAAGGRLFFIVVDATCGPVIEAEASRTALLRPTNDNSSKRAIKSAQGVQWREFGHAASSSAAVPSGTMVVVEHEHEIVDIAWHRRGDYVAVVTQL